MAKKQTQKLLSGVIPAQTTAKQGHPLQKTGSKISFSIKNLCIALAVISFLLYVNTLQNGYVMDDVIVLKENTIVMKGIQAIPELFRTPHMHGYLIIPNDMYRPLSLAMFAVEYQFFGANPVVNHFFNIVVFIGCVIMLFLYLNKFFDRKKTAIAFIAALIFAIHPIHTEVVANIKSRDELLCFFFAFWSLNLFMDYMSKSKIVLLLGGALTLFLSYLSKETVITFLGVIPLLFFVYKNEYRKRAILITSTTVLVTVLFLVIRAAVLNAYHANEPAAIDFIDNALVKSSGITKLATEIVIMGRYLWLQFIPYPLLSTYAYNAIPFASLGSISFWLSLLAYIFLIYVVITRMIKNNKDPWAFAILFFLITLSLFSNIPFLMGAAMAERFAFFASAGFCLAVALAVEKWTIKAAATDIMILKSANVLVILIPVLLIFSSMTIARNAEWKDDYTLYKADLQKSPENSRLYQYIATALAEKMYPEETDTIRRKEMDAESIGYLKKALQIYPDYTEAHVELGRIYDRNKMYDDAIIEDQKALTINPEHATANNNLGSVYLSTGKYKEAVDLFRRSILINPRFSYSYFNLARAYQQLKQYDSTVIYFKKALQFDSKNFDVESELGLAYYFLQQYDSSEAHLRLALAIKPDDVNANNTLGAIYLNAKKYPQAIEIIKKSLTLNPNYITGISNLARAYFFNNQFPQAIEMFNRELSIDPKSPRDVPYLALSYQKTGNMEMARKYETIARQYYSNFKLQ